MLKKIIYMILFYFIHLFIYYVIFNHGVYDEFHKYSFYGLLKVILISILNYKCFFF